MYLSLAALVTMTVWRRVRCRRVAIEAGATAAA